MGVGVDLLEGRNAFQKDLDRLSHWTEDNCMTFHKVKCCVQNLCPSSPMQCYRQGKKWLESSLAEKGSEGPG